MNSKDHYNRYLEKITNIYNETLANSMDQNNKCQGIIHDVAEWLQCIDVGGVKRVFEHSLELLESSSILCSMGLYRQAFTSLRLCIELFIAGIVFSSNDYKFRLWQMGNYDLIWSRLASTEDPPFSKEFEKAYKCEIFKKEFGKTIHVEAREVYRNLSEHVHGNYFTIREKIETISYNQKHVTEYNGYLKTTERVLTYLFTVRFFNEIENEDIFKLQGSLSDNIPEGLKN